MRGSPGWQSWDFSQLITALRTWKEIHPVESTLHEEKAPSRPSRSFYSRNESVSSKKCVYCDDVSHRSVQCKVLSTPVERRRKLQERGLCFNCTGGKHHAAQCRSNAVCQYCKKRHHSSICDNEGAKPRTTVSDQESNDAVTQERTTTVWTAAHNFEGEDVCHPRHR